MRLMHCVVCHLRLYLCTICPVSLCWRPGKKKKYCKVMRVRVRERTRHAVQMLRGCRCDSLWVFWSDRCLCPSHKDRPGFSLAGLGETGCSVKRAWDKNRPDLSSFMLRVLAAVILLYVIFVCIVKHKVKRTLKWYFSLVGRFIF